MLGFSTAKLLFFFLSILFTLERSHYAWPHEGSEEFCSISFSMEYLHKLFEIPLPRRFIYTYPCKELDMTEWLTHLHLPIYLFLHLSTNYLRFLYLGDLSTLIPPKSWTWPSDWHTYTYPFIYFFIYLYLYRSINIYSMLWVIIQ